MIRIITIDSPELIALIEKAAEKLTKGDKIEAITLAMRGLLDESRTDSLFGAHRDSVSVRAGVDVTAPSLDILCGSENDQDIDR